MSSLHLPRPVESGSSTLSMTYNDDDAFDGIVVTTYFEDDVADNNITMDDAMTPSYIPTIKQSVHVVVIYSLVYSVVFILALAGNLLVVTVVYRNQVMHNVTNYFIVNLAVADILVGVFCLPITLLTNIYSGWRFGAVMCKLVPFLQGVAVCASVSTLGAISFDRYLAICHLLEFRLTRRMARTVIIFIWMGAALVWLPVLIVYERVEDQTFSDDSEQTVYVCSESWSEEQQKQYFLGVFIICYTVPLCFITAFYTAVCHRVWNRDVHGALSTSRIIHDSKIIIPVAQWLGLANSCVNPIVYCLFSRKFRLGFAELVHCCCRPKAGKMAAGLNGRGGRGGTFSSEYGSMGGWSARGGCRCGGGAGAEDRSVAFCLQRSSRRSLAPPHHVNGLTVPQTKCETPRRYMPSSCELTPPVNL